MTREIKFRARDKNKNIFVYPGDNQLGGQNTRTNGDILNYFEDEEIMQYVGLRDKNGIEIYEGDIVYILFDYSDNILEEYRGKRIIQTIKFNLGDDDMHRIANIDCKYLTISGNIYQNPELLSEK